MTNDINKIDNIIVERTISLTGYEFRKMCEENFTSKMGRTKDLTDFIDSLSEYDVKKIMERVLNKVEHICILNSLSEELFEIKYIFLNNDGDTLKEYYSR